MSRCTFHCRVLLTSFVACFTAGVPVKTEEPASARLTFHPVSVPIRSYRLLSMSMDDAGGIWAGSIHRIIHRYDPKAGTVESVRLPGDAVASSCICAGNKVYILGQGYPRLIVYNRTTRSFTQHDYPTGKKPDVWYGTEVPGERYLYLFDRNGGVIRWDTRTDTGETIPYPYRGPLPAAGSHEPRDAAIWCRIFDLRGGQYVPLGMARLDVATNRFTHWQAHPTDGADLKPYTDPERTFFVPVTLAGKLLPYDFKERRWCKPLDVPGFNSRFAFLGGPCRHRDRYYFSLSTYNGTPTGCDGKPYHFCNAVLEFDPQRRTFAFPTLETPDTYYQFAYLLSAHGHLYVTGTNIREADGRLNRDRAGEVVFWQTRPPGKK